VAQVRLEEGAVKTLTIEEALAYVREQRRRWCLLGIDARTGYKTYTCSNCLLFRFTRVTNATAPDKCPRCGARQVMP
jgi:rubrerythrin